MLDRTPPGRYSVVERGGRLVVIDRDTGQVPATAAERMAEHDRRMGNTPVRPAKPEVSAAPAAPPPGLTPPPADRLREAIAARPPRAEPKQPWSKASPPPTPARIPNRPQATPPASRAPQRPPPTNGTVRKTVVTAKWWDAKGPRTIELGPKGQSTLSGGFVTIFAAVLALCVFLFLTVPVAAFIAAFLLFQFGGAILAPIGAGIVDKAVAERG